MIPPIETSHATVIGAARSGIAVAKLLNRNGAEVFVTEHSEGDAAIRQAVREAGIEAEFGGHTSRALEADFIAISPGVPSDAPLVRQAQGREIPVYSELEVASWFWNQPIVAITGTNGKTTTTSLLGHIFGTAGRRPLVAGNIGKAFSDRADDGDAYDMAVLEVSSFQLDHIATFRPDVSVILNITPDHLDRYQNSFKNYTESKFRIFTNQKTPDALVYSVDDTQAKRGAHRARSERGIATYAFSHQREVDQGAFLRDGRIVLHLEEETDLMSTADLSLRGRHNTDNSLAAAIAARVIEVPLGDIRKSLSTFEGVAHRLETVRDVDGVRFVNDSKATNVNAVWYALESFHEPIILIAGGRDKGNDYTQLKPLVRKNVRAVIAIGESAEKVHRELGQEAPHSEIAETLELAVQRAFAVAEGGDVVLMSPACSSFDRFENFEERGDSFRRAVMNL